MEDINRIKVVLVEKKRTNKWLPNSLGLVLLREASDALIQLIHP